MATLDEVTKEKEQVNAALARVDAEREKITRQLSELEATERVLALYSKGTQSKKTASARTPTTAAKALTSAGKRGQRWPATAKPVRNRRSIK